MFHIDIDDTEVLVILKTILEKVNTLATQADVDTLVARIAQFETDLGTALTGIQDELTAALAANPGVNLAALSTAVDALTPLLVIAQTEALEIPPVVP
jgi:hypothetical protein